MTQRFIVSSGPAPKGGTLYVVWDREKEIYVDSSRSKDEMYALASALNAASNPASEPKEEA